MSLCLLVGLSHLFVVRTVEKKENKKNKNIYVTKLTVNTGNRFAKSK